jgi:glycerol uptake facilitator-like aquaporin
MGESTYFSLPLPPASGLQLSRRTASTSFANPSVAIARSLTNTFAGIRPLDLPGFIAIQVIGAVRGLGLAFAA